MSTIEAPKFTPSEPGEQLTLDDPAFDTAEHIANVNHAFAEQQAEIDRVMAEYSDEDYRRKADELIAAATGTPMPQEVENSVVDEVIDQPSENRLRFRQAVEEDDRNHAEIMERESKSRIKDVTRKALASKAVRFFTERRTTDSEAVVENDSETESESERPSRRERIKNLISRGNEARKRRFSRQDTYRLERLHKKAAKLEEKTKKIYEQADPIQDAIDAKEYSDMRDEADHDNELFDAHEEAIEMDKRYDTDHAMWEEAKALMHEDFEQRDAAAREARLQAVRDEIAEQTRIKNDEILRKALEKIDKRTKKSAAKQEKVSDDIRFKRVRSLTARALQTINRQ